MSTDDTASPPLAALFLINFDLKVGYTIAWKKAVENVELDGVVEFKSLPSGSHTVKDDLIYFVHEQYAGLSAFVNQPSDETHRNAQFVAVGILVPLSYGRLGRSWLHAQKLQQLARKMVANGEERQPLEQFWEEQQMQPQMKPEASESPPATSPNRPSPQVLGQSDTSGRSKPRALSTSTAVNPTEQSLSPYHPALSLLRYIDIFGPLIFPLHRAALLRKRILFVAPPPVRQACEFVYDLSILTPIPTSTALLLPQTAEPLSRLRPFFNLGIHDIPLLQREAQQPPTEDDSGAGIRGWVACTTDEILTMKTNLYDLIVEIPSVLDPSSQNRAFALQNRRWPTLKTAKGGKLKATQRDLRRFKALRQALAPALRPQQKSSTAYSDEPVVEDEQSSLLPHSKPSRDSSSEAEATAEESQTVEATSWSALAYSSFMWWASAGERDEALDHEEHQDSELLGDLVDIAADAAGGWYKDEPEDDDGPSKTDDQDVQTNAEILTALIAFFHRYTAQLFAATVDAFEAEDGSDSERSETAEGEVVLDSEDLRRMGLDAWSESDALFAKELARRWWGRDVSVRRAGVEACGVRLC
ncbi:hypothetical protein K402DRAFT_376606 [Aulographum hederae CBS 113979]|uniref:DUF4484 domain-containing protein n=1 Tax=Aulographum hederae CBS 113979 TaxID=1176131 RepID=A0A6G1H188_9PEZI|nr:hypothetical protein K402DRAFT_376606 [Aulographum hederae CBS 113979]